jgi:hypothetical protein
MGIDYFLGEYSGRHGCAAMREDKIIFENKYIVHERQTGTPFARFAAQGSGGLSALAREET